MKEQTIKNLNKLVQRNYQSIAIQFDTTRRKRNWPELSDFIATIKPEDQTIKILDVGCGNGRLFELVSDKNVNYLGVDNCEELIKIASERYVDNDRARFLVRDVTKLNELPDINFDYVFSIAMIHHLPGFKLRLEALKQLKNKIKPDGVIYISAWNLWNQPKYKKLILKFFILKLLGKHQMDFGDIIFDWQDNQGQIISQRYYHAMTMTELKKLARLSKLKISKLYKDKYNYYLVLSK